MKKLLSLEEFESTNSILKLNNNSCNIYGGMTAQSGDWCQTLDDTCTNNRSDIHHSKSVDGVVVFDNTYMTENC